MARVEAGISDHLAAPAQHPRLRQLREEQAGQCLADTDDAEQQVASAAQLGLLVDRCLGNGLIDGLELRGEVRRRGELACGVIAEAAAE